MIIFTEHRFFLESVHSSKDDMLFAMTTDAAIAKEYGCVFEKGTVNVMFCKVETEEIDTAFFSKMSNKNCATFTETMLQSDVFC